MIGDKIKSLRANKGLSQNELAERLNVSRQAVTKWESNNGAPDIDNIVAISDLFGISIDSLVRNEFKCFSSIIQYDIETAKDFELDITPSKSLSIEGHNSEKIRIEMSSDTISDLDSDLKAYIDDNRRNISIRIGRKNDLTDSECREDLVVRILLPKEFISRIELKTDTEELHLCGFTTKNMEFNGSARTIVLKDVHGQTEMDVRSDCTFLIYDLDGTLEINQIERSSVLRIPRDAKFNAVNAGRKCELDISKKLAPNVKCEDVIEFNGSKSALSIKVLESNP